ncbi:hypothetical protein D3C72_1810120 [compost metagenome]
MTLGNAWTATIFQRGRLSAGAYVLPDERPPALDRTRTGMPRHTATLSDHPIFSSSFSHVTPPPMNSQGELSTNLPWATESKYSCPIKACASDTSLICADPSGWHPPKVTLRTRDKTVCQVIYHRLMSDAFSFSPVLPDNRRFCPCDSTIVTPLGARP